jgi:NAD(P)-dependent dehydrogenase (short-subunit alcohol dehydrogenase family)
MSRQGGFADGLPVWFVTGASSGLGASVARRALAAGDVVVATFRRRPNSEPDGSMSS